MEGLPQRTGTLRGEEPDALIKIEENGLHFWVDVRGGHKTGYYLDQRRNRLRVRSLAKGRSVLDCFSYTGGFSANAMAGNARTLVMVDKSRDALALAEKNLVENGLLSPSVSFLEGNVFYSLRNFRDPWTKI